MGVKYYFSHPVIGVRKILFFIFGNTFGRIFYPAKMFKSRWFNSLTEKGWEWVSYGIINQKIKGKNGLVPWPVSPYQNITNPKNIDFHYDDINNFQMIGSYFQAQGKISIGKGTYIAQNVGFITANHDFNNLDKHLLPKSIQIGNNCWIGMNSIILPGVKLGNRTMVGAGSVVTKSFEEGNCIIAGNPAKIIKYLLDEDTYRNSL